MTNMTSRRGALATMAAAATVAVIPTADAALLTADPVISLADKCKGVLAEYVEAARIHHALYAEVWAGTEELLEQAKSAEYSGNSQGDALRKRWREEFDRLSTANGYFKACRAVEGMARLLRKNVVRLVDTHATSLHGVTAKIDVMQAVEREYEDPDTIEGYDEWLGIIRADIERIGGAS